MVGRSGAYRVFVGKPEGKRPLGRIRYSCEVNIRIDVKEIGWEGVDRIDLAQNRENLEVVLYMVMNVWVP
jgi:hypothetical protein